MVLQMTFLSFITIHSWTIYRPVWSCLKEGFKSSMASCRNCINNVLQSAVTTMPVIILNYVWDEELKSKNHRCIGSMSSSYRLPLMICDHHSEQWSSFRVHSLIHTCPHPYISTSCQGSGSIQREETRTWTRQACYIVGIQDEPELCPKKTYRNMMRT